jgi:protein-L-isoaspartate(D-aspartate) O-methyltransferase
VTAALEHVPPPLIDQLKIGGRLVMPVGPVPGGQQMMVVEKTGPATTKSRTVAPVMFVPFTR